jgi:hypothetical protein
MASNINPYNIDGTFPVAGQDNSSQGFRDNFTNIKNNFTYAENEISDLQNKAILTSALNGQTLNNDMAGSQIKRPQLTAWTQSLIDKGTILLGQTTILDFGSTGASSNGANFQKLATPISDDEGTINIQLIGWPGQNNFGNGALGYGVMRVWIKINNRYHTITLDPKINVGVSDIAGSTENLDLSHTIKFDVEGDYIFDFSSIDGGDSYQIFDVSRNRVSFRDPELYFNNTVLPTLLVGYGDGFEPVLALETGGDRISANGSINSVTIGNLSTANVSYNELAGGGGQVAGYSVTAARGFLANANVQVVQNGDYLGYFGSYAYSNYHDLTTNTNTVTIAQEASINFFAKGANAWGGLGGNIVMMTSPDGRAGFLKQAVGIENDQSTTFYGNVTINGNIATTGRKVDTGFTVQSFISNNNSGNTYVIPDNISTVIIDTDGINANLTYANIELPRRPVHGQTVKMVFLANITRNGLNGGANIYPGSFGSPVIKYLPKSDVSSTFPNISGNTSITLQFASTINGFASNVWYRV